MTDAPPDQAADEFAPPLNQPDRPYAEMATDLLEVVLPKMGRLCAAYRDAGMLAGSASIAREIQLMNEELQLRKG